MEFQTKTFSVESVDRLEIRNVTAEVQAAVDELDVTDGLVYVRTPHTSAALSTNEYEKRLVYDMIETFKTLVPPDDGYYHDVEHIYEGEQPNAHAHLLAALIGHPVFSLLRDGMLDLGQWEEVLFFELCGPRERTVEVTTVQ